MYVLFVICDFWPGRLAGRLVEDVPGVEQRAAAEGAAHQLERRAPRLQGPELVVDVGEAVLKRGGKTDENGGTTRPANR